MERIALFGTSTTMLMALLVGIGVAVGSPLLVILAVAALASPVCVPVPALSRVVDRRRNR